MFASESHGLIRVFLSGPRGGLHHQWQLARHALERMDCVVETMEYWSPEARPPIEVIEDHVRRCHVFILLVQDRMGEELPPEVRERLQCDCRTYTEHEHHLADTLGIPRLAFFMKPDEAGSASAEEQAAVEAFRAKVQADKRATAASCESDHEFLIPLMDGMQREASRMMRGTLRSRLQFELRKDFQVQEEIGRGDTAVVFGVKSWSDDTQPLAARVVEYDPAFRSDLRPSVELKGEGVMRAYHHQANRLLGIEYWLLEHVDGVTLDRLIRAVGCLPVALAVDMTLRVAEILARQHHAENAHSNLSPSNVYVDDRARVCLSPFAPRASLSGRRLYTSEQLLYLAPEQREPELVEGRAGVTIDLARADQHSLGRVALYALRGAHEGPEDLDADARLQHVPARLRSILSRMTRTDPGERYSMLDEAIRDLDEIRPIDDEVAESFDRCLDTGFARDFYDRLFAKDESLRAFFGEDVSRVQLLFLRVAIHLLIRHDANRELLAKVATDHAELRQQPVAGAGPGRHLTVADYETFGEALLETIHRSDSLIRRKSEVAERLKQAWKERVAHGLEYMKTHGVPRAQVLE